MPLSLIPSPYPIVHIARLTTGEEDPDTGNYIIKDLPPVVRYAQLIEQIGRIRGSSKNIETPEFLKRVETEIHMSVADPTTYGAFDQVLLFPELDENGDWISGTGFAFIVDGIPYDGRRSPWPLFTRALGGLVRLRRVT